MSVSVEATTASIDAAPALSKRAVVSVPPSLPVARQPLRHSGPEQKAETTVGHAQQDLLAQRLETILRFRLDERGAVGEALDQEMGKEELQKGLLKLGLHLSNSHLAGSQQ